MTLHSCGMRYHVGRAGAGEALCKWGSSLPSLSTVKTKQNGGATKTFAGFSSVQAVADQYETWIEASRSLVLRPKLQGHTSGTLILFSTGIEVDL